jgi:sodium/proline symporter
VLLGAGVTMAYTFVGGYKAVAYTDVVQGVMMLLGLIVMPIAAIHAAGGWGVVTSRLGTIDPGLLSLVGTGGSGAATWVVIASFLAIGLPFLGVPQMMVRFMSARSGRDIVQAGFISVAVIFAFDVGAVLTGMAGRALFPNLGDPETIFPLLAGELFPPVITGVFMVVVVAAIMSTVDSLLLLAASAVVRDFFQKILGREQRELRLTRYGKAATLLIGVIGVAFALQESRLIFWFVLFAWSGLGAAFAPPILAGLFDRRMNHAGAVAGILGGFVTTIVWVVWFKERTFELYEMIPGLAIGLGLAFVVSRLTPDRSP